MGCLLIHEEAQYDVLHYKILSNIIKWIAQSIFSSMFLVKDICIPGDKSRISVADRFRLLRDTSGRERSRKGELGQKPKHF